MSKQKTLQLIEDFQKVQKTNRPDSVAWLKASKELKRLFMAMEASQ